MVFTNTTLMYTLWKNIGMTHRIVLTPACKCVQAWPSGYGTDYLHHWPSDRFECGAQTVRRQRFAAGCVVGLNARSLNAANDDSLLGRHSYSNGR
jgi:hypothetical protein